MAGRYGYETHPYLVTQQSGCCGFAAVLMALLERAQQDTVKKATWKTRFDEFYECVTLPNKTMSSLAGSGKIHTRLLKRIEAGFIDANYPLEEDQALCIALMIALKLKLHDGFIPSTGHKYAAKWQRCLDFSAKFSGWQKDARWVKGFNPSGTFTSLKSMLAEARQAQPVHQVSVPTFFAKDGLNYKKGDLALPADVVPDTLDLVGIASLKTSNPGDTVAAATLIHQDLSTRKTSCAAFTKAVYLGQSTSWGTGAFHGMILGLCENKSDTFKDYDYIAHWVYVPKVPMRLTSTGSDDFVVWTWGREILFWQDLGDDWTPVYAIHL